MNWNEIENRYGESWPLFTWYDEIQFIVLIRLIWFSLCSFSQGVKYLLLFLWFNFCISVVTVTLVPGLRKHGALDKCCEFVKSKLKKTKTQWVDFIEQKVSTFALIKVYLFAPIVFLNIFSHSRLQNFFQREALIKRGEINLLVLAWHSRFTSIL